MSKNKTMNMLEIVKQHKRKACEQLKVYFEDKYPDDQFDLVEDTYKSLFIEDYLQTITGVVEHDIHNVRMLKEQIDIGLGENDASVISVWSDYVEEWLANNPVFTKWVSIDEGLAIADFIFKDSEDFKLFDTTFTLNCK